MLAKYKVLKLEMCEESNNIVIQDILTNVPANNEEVALADAFFEFLVEVIEESLSWVAIIIMILQVATLLSIYA